MASSAGKGHIEEVDPLEDELSVLYREGMAIIDAYNAIVNRLENVPINDKLAFVNIYREAREFNNHHNEDVERIVDGIERVLNELITSSVYAKVGLKERKNYDELIDRLHLFYSNFARRLKGVDSFDEVNSIVNERTEIYNARRKTEMGKTQSQNQQMRQGRGSTAQLSSKYRDRDLDTMRACLKCGAVEPQTY